MKSKSARNAPSSVNEHSELNVAPLSPLVETPEVSKADEQRIRELAFNLYEQHGRIDGHDLKDWLEGRRWFVRVVNSQRRGSISKKRWLIRCDCLNPTVTRVHESHGPRLRRFTAFGVRARREAN
jgi:hypothetical protein